MKLMKIALRIAVTMIVTMTSTSVNPLARHGTIGSSLHQAGLGVRVMARVSPLPEMVTLVIVLASGVLVVGLV